MYVDAETSRESRFFSGCQLTARLTDLTDWATGPGTTLFHSSVLLSAHCSVCSAFPSAQPQRQRSAGAARDRQAAGQWQSVRLAGTGSQVSPKMASAAAAMAAAATSPPTTPPVKRAKIAGVADPENASKKSPDTERWTGDVQVAGEGLIS